MNQPELIVNLNVSNAPTGVYSLEITPQRSDNGIQDNYNLLVNTQFDQQFHENANDTEEGKW